MKTLFAWIVVTGSALLLSMAPCRAQQTRQGLTPRPLEIQGRVLPAPGETSLPKMVMITLRASGSAYEATQMVKPDGTFEFRSIPRANYELIVESDGHEPTVMALHENESQGGTVRVNLSVGRRTGGEVLPGGSKVVDARLAGAPAKAIKELEKAQKEQADKNFDRALKHLKKAIDIHPEFTAAYDSLAVLQLKMGQREEAEASLQKSIELDPDGKTAQKNLGFVYLSTGREEEAIVPLTRAAELDPTDVETQGFLGEAYYQVGKHAQAEAPLRAALDLSPDFFRASYRLGYVYLELKKYPEALQTFRQFLETNKGIDSTKVESIVQQLEAALGQ